jgi:hypothetical protein
MPRQQSSGDAAGTPCSADSRNVSLTEGYKSNFPLFHKLFLSTVENWLSVLRYSSFLVRKDLRANSEGRTTSFRHQNKSRLSRRLSKFKLKKT